MDYDVILFNGLFLILKKGVKMRILDKVSYELPQSYNLSLTLAEKTEKVGDWLLAPLRKLGFGSEVKLGFYQNFISQHNNSRSEKPRKPKYKTLPTRQPAKDYKGFSEIFIRRDMAEIQEDYEKQCELIRSENRNLRDSYNSDLNNWTEGRFDAIQIKSKSVDTSTAIKVMIIALMVLTLPISLGAICLGLLAKGLATVGNEVKTKREITTESDPASLALVSLIQKRWEEQKAQKPSNKS